MLYYIMSIMYFLFCFVFFITRAGVCDYPTEVCCAFTRCYRQTSGCGAGCAALKTGGGISGREMAQLFWQRLNYSIECI